MNPINALLLEVMNLVESSTEITDGNRARKVYQLTPEGWEAFRDAIRELTQEPEHLCWKADAAFYNLGALPVEQQKELLQNYQVSLKKAIGEFEALEKFMLEMQCSVQHVSIVRRWFFLAQGEIKWVEDFIQRLN